MSEICSEHGAGCRTLQKGLILLLSVMWEMYLRAHEINSGAGKQDTLRYNTRGYGPLKQNKLQLSGDIGLLAYDITRH